MANGYNPIRNVTAFEANHIPVERFAECFPGNIGVSDLDGIVELNNNFIIFEGKSYLFPSEEFLRTGQGMMLQRVSELPRMTVCLFVHNGPAINFDITHYVYMRGGKWHGSDTSHGWKETTTSGLLEVVKGWSARIAPGRM